MNKRHTKEVKVIEPAQPYNKCVMMFYATEEGVTPEHIPVTRKEMYEIIEEYQKHGTITLKFPWGEDKKRLSPLFIKFFEDVGGYNATYAAVAWEDGEEEPKSVFGRKEWDERLRRWYENMKFLGRKR